MLTHYQGEAVLVTGGTRGIGLATGLAFGRAGARVWLTHRWGSADEGEILKQFAAIGAPAPVIVEADAGNDADTVALVERIAREHERLMAFVCNVCVAGRGTEVLALEERTLNQTLDVSSWPLCGTLQALERGLGSYPRYVLAMSSDGPDTHYPGYEYVAVAKAVLETFVRYLSVRLRPKGVRVNALRTRQVLTESYTEIFGPERVALAQCFESLLVPTDEVGRAAFALCSGLMDGMSGQVLLLDRGAAFVDNVMSAGAALYEARP